MAGFGCDSRLQHFKALPSYLINPAKQLVNHRNGICLDTDRFHSKTFEGTEKKVHVTQVDFGVC